MLFVEDNTPVIVQGMTGHQGMTHTARMLKAGTNIVGGVNPRKAGTSVTFPAAKNGTDVDVPVFATCDEAREATGAKASAEVRQVRRRRSDRGRHRAYRGHHRRHSGSGFRLLC